MAAAACEGADGATFIIMFYHILFYPTKSGWKVEESVGAGVGCEGAKNHR